MYDIILVEDNASDAELAIRALKKKNITNLLHLKDGEEALDYFFGKGKYEGRNTQEFPKLILLDIKMPKINGLQVLKELKSNLSTQIIPIVLLTSSKEDFDLIEGYKSGANSYIIKPVEYDNFIKVVSELGIYWIENNSMP